jgi:hypothetical protein
MNNAQNCAYMNWRPCQRWIVNHLEIPGLYGIVYLRRDFCWMTVLERHNDGTMYGMPMEVVLWPLPCAFRTWRQKQQRHVSMLCQDCYWKWTRLCSQTHFVAATSILRKYCLRTSCSLCCWYYEVRCNLLVKGFNLLLGSLCGRLLLVVREHQIGLVVSLMTKLFQVAGDGGAHVKT